ncbi:MAG: archaemetzincin family Zn-dependent metalloprotease [candidate division WOR-3 bacterium]
MTIYLMPIGEIDPLIIEQIRQAVICAFGMPVEILAMTSNPTYAYEPKRNQYYSARILEKLTELIPNPDDKILGIANVDLATPVLTFVFGEAQLNGNACVISLERLKQEFYQLLPNQQLLISRAVKEAVHELGHTFGLLHCRDRTCVMHFSSNIVGIDQKQLNFCADCLTVLKKKLQSL